jgi:hypothetical protein
MAISTAAAIVGSAVVGGIVSSRAASKAAKAQTRAAETGVGEQRAARLAFEERTEPFREVGLEGAEQLTSFLQDPTQQLEQINPVVSFLRDQGFEQIQESAAARGRLGAGGTLQDLTRFNLDLAATVAPQLQNQRFNQLFNVAGLGANVAAGQGTAGLQAATNVSNLLGQAGRAQAAGTLGQAGAITGAIQNVAGAVGAFPNLFGAQTPPPPPGTGGGFQFDPSSVPAGSITGATF